jgi:hypothetical protein
MRNPSIVMLNPQPLPPGPPPEERISFAFNRFNWVMLNPQPLPPRVLLNGYFVRGF